VAKPYHQDARHWNRGKNPKRKEPPADISPRSPLVPLRIKAPFAYMFSGLFIHFGVCGLEVLAGNYLDNNPYTRLYTYHGWRGMGLQHLLGATKRAFSFFYIF